MARRSPVAFFLGDVGFLSDPKFRRLGRLLPDPDDFNSAVGAFWIAVAASRRNGSPELDIAGETDSRHVDALVKAGLLTPTGFPQESWKSWGAMSPQQAEAGRLRAKGAERDDAGRFTSALDALDEGSQRGPALPSPPIPSSPSSTEGVQGEEVDLFAYIAQHGAFIRPESGLGQRLVGLIDRRGVPLVMDMARKLTTDERMSDRQWVFGLERALEEVPSPPMEEMLPINEQKSSQIYDRMMARRIEYFRETGKWDDGWGSRPAA